MFCEERRALRGQRHLKVCPPKWLSRYMKKSDKKYTSKIISIKENIPILPTGSSIQAVKGLLKGSRFSTKKYFQFKKEDKHLEDNCLDTRFLHI